MASVKERRLEEEIKALERERALVRARADAELAAAEQVRRDGLRRRDAGDYPGRQMPLAYWMGWKILQDTRGSARLDLVRPRPPAVEPSGLFRRVAPTVPDMPGRAPYGGSYGRSRASYQDPAPLLGFGQGARIKIMRHIDFGVPDRWRSQRAADRRRAEQLEQRRQAAAAYDESSGLLRREPDLGAAASAIGDALKEGLRPPEKPWFDFGAGLNLELDEGALRPSVRLKVKDFFSIKLLPEPMLKVQKRLRLGATRMGVRVNYELPLADARSLWQPPARLMVRLDDSAGGLRVGPGGADFDEHVLQLGSSASVRAALSCDFPRTLPLEEGAKLFGWRARRLGIKTRW